MAPTATQAATHQGCTINSGEQLCTSHSHQQAAWCHAGIGSSADSCQLPNSNYTQQQCTAGSAAFTHQQPAAHVVGAQPDEAGEEPAEPVVPAKAARALPVPGGASGRGKGNQEQPDLPAAAAAAVSITGKAA